MEHINLQESGNALLKALYLATFELTKKWTLPIRNWGQVEYAGQNQTAKPDGADSINGEILHAHRRRRHLLDGAGYKAPSAH